MCFAILFIATSGYIHAQNDTEFPKGFIMYAKLHNGMVTDLKVHPDLYVGGVQLAPQLTVIEHTLRAGIIADGFYTDKRIDGAFGPSLSLKIKTFKAALQGAPIGSIGNINLIVSHVWGSGHQRLLGGGVIADLGNIITIGITAHKDYFLNTWWFQNEIGVRISKPHKNRVI